MKFLGIGIPELVIFLIIVVIVIAIIIIVKSVNKLSNNQQQQAHQRPAGLITCPSCGKQVSASATFCPNCGTSVASIKQSMDFTDPVSGGQTVLVAGDAPSMGFAVLGFFIPLVGLILYLVWKDQFPLKARSCGKGALIGVITWVVVVFLCFVLIFVLAMVVS